MVHNSPEAVAQQNAAMKAQLAHVTALVEEYCNISTAQAGKECTLEEKGKQSSDHTRIVQETHKLLHAIKGPLDTVFCHFENVRLLTQELSEGREGTDQVDEYQPVELQFYKLFRENAMQAQSSAASWAIALYPFREVLSELETTDDTPLVVDIGGGKGHTISQIRGLTGEGIKGRFILQERQLCLDDITEGLPGIERQAYDFFTPQPIKNASNSAHPPTHSLCPRVFSPHQPPYRHSDAAIYYFRRIFHDWKEASCVEILRNVAKGITDKTRQRIVIADNILPSKDADAEGAWMDLTMVTFTGTERTEKQ
ncbi:hypothetical protein FQN55_006483 [Onygenales sp. PD_40]|nr:hypothetical protein FQN55_006483 [Onygenales sp. PD_40]KAK2787502.1 hypothetical protein FQN52_007220 [Onygenales sp. PD_12]